MKVSQEDRDTSIATLNGLIKPGDTIWGVVRYRSRQGTKQVIQFIKFDLNRYQDNRIEPYYLGSNIANVLGARYDRGYGGVAISGGGMDLGLHIVTKLAAVLYPKGAQVIGCNADGVEVATKTVGIEQIFRYENL